MNSLMFLANKPGGFVETLSNLWSSTGFITGGEPVQIVLKICMMLLACFFVYLAVVKKFEPNLLLSIAFGMFLINIPGAFEILYPVKNIDTILGATAQEIINDTSQLESILINEGSVELINSINNIYITELGTNLPKSILVNIQNELTNPDLFMNITSVEGYVSVISGIYANYLPSVDIASITSAINLDSIILNTSNTQVVVDSISKIFISNTGALLPSNVIVQIDSLLNNPIGFKSLSESIRFVQDAYSVTANAMISPGLFDFLFKGVEWVIFPPIIFLGIGAMTDFGPLIANPKSLLLGAAAQIGIFITLLGALAMGDMFDPFEASAIAIIGGADGPTAIYVTAKLAPHLLGSISIAAYSYMALVPVIQPPIMKLLTTKKERQIRMEQRKPVSKAKKVMFPIIVTGIVGIILPSAMPLLGMLMLGNLMKESGVVPRLVDTASNALINIVTILLGFTVGTKAYAPVFLTTQTLLIMVLGVVAFSIGTAFGVLFGKLMSKLDGGKTNPLIGAAGVSAVPMAARVAQDVGKKEDPNNYLLMHAMGPNVAGVIGSAVAAGILLAVFGVA